MEFQLSYPKSWYHTKERWMNLRIVNWCAPGHISYLGKQEGWGRTVFQGQGNAKCSNCHTIALISHASKVMLKILQARLQQQWTMNLQMFKLFLEKAEEPEIKLDHGKSKRVPEKHLLLLYWLCQSLWLSGSQQTGKFFKRWEYQTILFASWEICMQSRSNC